MSIGTVVSWCPDLDPPDQCDPCKKPKPGGPPPPFESFPPAGGCIVCTGGGVTERVYVLERDGTPVYYFIADMIWTPSGGFLAGHVLLPNPEPGYFLGPVYKVYMNFFDKCNDVFFTASTDLSGDPGDVTAAFVALTGVYV